MKKRDIMQEMRSRADDTFTALQRGDTVGCLQAIFAGEFFGDMYGDMDLDSKPADYELSFEEMRQAFKNGRRQFERHLARMGYSKRDILELRFLAQAQDAEDQELSGEEADRLAEEGGADE